MRSNVDGVLRDAARNINKLEQQILTIREQIKEFRGAVKATGVPVGVFNFVRKQALLEGDDRAEAVHQTRVCYRALLTGEQGDMFADIVDAAMPHDDDAHGGMDAAIEDLTSRAVRAAESAAAVRAFDEPESPDEQAAALNAGGTHYEAGRIAAISGQPRGEHGRKGRAAALWLAGYDSVADGGAVAADQPARVDAIEYLPGISA